MPRVVSGYRAAPLDKANHVPPPALRIPCCARVSRPRTLSDRTSPFRPCTTATTTDIQPIVTDTTLTRRPSSRHRATLYSLGVLILLLGLSVAGVIHWRTQHRFPQPTSPSPSGWQDTSLSREDSKKSSRDIEMYYGKIGL